MHCFFTLLYGIQLIFEVLTFVKFKSGASITISRLGFGFDSHCSNFFLYSII